MESYVRLQKKREEYVSTTKKSENALDISIVDCLRYKLSIIAQVIVKGVLMMHRSYSSNEVLDEGSW